MRRANSRTDRAIGSMNSTFRISSGVTRAAPSGTPLFFKVFFVKVVFVVFP